MVKEKMYREEEEEMVWQIKNGILSQLCSLPLSASLFVSCSGPLLLCQADSIARPWRKSKQKDSDYECPCTIFGHAQKHFYKPGKCPLTDKHTYAHTLCNVLSKPIDNPPALLWCVPLALSLHCKRRMDVRQHWNWVSLKSRQELWGGYHKQLISPCVCVFAYQSILNIPLYPLLYF